VKICDGFAHGQLSCPRAIKWPLIALELSQALNVMRDPQ
jgi:hypothetical protein